MLVSAKLSDGEVVATAEEGDFVVYLFDLSDGDYIYSENVGSGYAQTLTHNTSRVWTNKGAEYIRLGQVYDLTGLTREQLVALAPEPATATLSLPALGALATRRRRNA